MQIKDWPRSERPREKLLTLGAGALSDAELLAIFIRTGIKGKTAVDLARELLYLYGGIRAILMANKKQLCEFHGMGSVTYTQFQAALELSKRHLQEAIPAREELKNSLSTRKYLQAKLRDYSHEIFACLFLDAQNRILRFEEMFTGSIAFAQVHPRNIVKRCMQLNAAAVILAHNHPTGIAEPSDADKAITQKIVQALSLIDVKVLDHIIVGDGEIVSFNEEGLL